MLNVWLLRPIKYRVVNSNLFLAFLAILQVEFLGHAVLNSVNISETGSEATSLVVIPQINCMTFKSSPYWVMWIST